MGGWSLLAITVVALGLGIAVYTKTKKKLKPSDEQVNFLKMNAKTLDVVLLRGKKWLDYAQRGFSKGSGFSHAALVIRGEDLPESSYGVDNDNIYLLQTSGKASLSNAEDFIKNYDGDRMSLCVLSEKYRTNHSPWKLKQVVAKYVGKNFDFVGTAVSVFPSLRVMGDNGKFFCSELVAAALRDLAVLPDSLDPRGVIPVDFSSGNDSDNSIPSDLIAEIIPFYNS